MISNQIRFTEEQDAKVRHLLTLSGGVLVVAVAVSGLVAGRTLDGSLGWSVLGVWGYLVPVSVSFATSFWAAALFAIAYNGSRRHPYRIHVGWDPNNLVKAAESGDTTGDVHLSTIRGVASWYSQNRMVIESSLVKLQQGTLLLQTSGAFLALALIYAVGASVQ